MSPFNENKFYLNSFLSGLYFEKYFSKNIQKDHPVCTLETACMIVICCSKKIFIETCLQIGII